MEDNGPVSEGEPQPLDENTLNHLARFASLNRARPTDYMGGSKLCFRTPPPAPIKIDTGSSFQDNPFLKGNKKAASK
jgi:hypothetical protein